MVELVKIVYTYVYDTLPMYEKVQIKLRHGTGHKNQKEKQEKYT